MSTTKSEISEALSFIPANGRELWVHMAMAVKSELGEAGFETWDAWSQKADNYNPKAALSVWKSIDESGPITIGTLIHEAKTRGWKLAVPPKGRAKAKPAGDDPIQCRDHVKRLLGIAWTPGRTTRQTPVQPKPAKPEDETMRKLAWRTWSEATRLPDPRVTIYFEARGLVLDAEAYGADALRFHIKCPVKIAGHLRCLPAIVQKLVDPCTNIFRGIQRTFLKRDFTAKADDLDDPRMMLGGAGVCKLVVDEDTTTVLGIGEGIETTLSMLQLPECYGIPVWACMSAGAMASFPVLPGIEVLWIAVDVGDDTGAGERAADQCAERWMAQGREVYLVEPRTTGSADLNDVVRSWRHG